MRSILQYLIIFGIFLRKNKNLEKVPIQLFMNV